MKPRTPLTLIGLAFALALFAGCAIQYQSKIKIAGAEFALPKDSRMGVLAIEIPTTNGAIRFYATNCTFLNNPDVLNAVTMHDIGVINATAAGLGALIQTGAKAAGVP